ncbi:FtsW/RodA/SpoVE family cell cycle protein [Pseudoduganella sp.]|uniref:FtsW/RodA/SpoVE family cell cycle protein n=1 Tax=Pseudoduganella sp. TaxID=1880898 RepID=UPI0035B11AFA
MPARCVTAHDAAPEAPRAALPAWRALLVLLAFLGLLLLGALLRAPAMWAPHAVTLRLAPGQAVSLEPLAPVSIQRDANGRWLLAAGPGQARTPVLLRANAAPESLATVPLPAAYLVLPGGNRVERMPAPQGSVAFQFAGSAWQYDGARLLRNGQPQAACPDARWSVRLAAWWNRLAPAALTLARPLSLGGSLHCGNRIGIADVLPDAAAISRSGDGTLRMTDLEHAPRPLLDVQSIAIGAMRLQLDSGAGGDAGDSVDSLILQPQRRLPLFSAPSVELPAQVEWQWSRRALWPALPSGPLQAAFVLALAVALAAGGLRQAARTSRGGTLAQAASAVALLAGGLLAMALQRAGQPAPAALLLLLAALAVGSWLAAPGARTVANGCAMLLLAGGLLVQLELGLGGGDLRYFQKMAALLAVGLGALGLWRLAPAAWRDAAGTPRAVERALLALALLALAALAAQVLWGDETGVFDMQPVELAKLSLCALTAHCLALRFTWHDGPQYQTTAERWLALAAPVLLFLALLAMALLQVDDYSPLLLLLLWAAGMALAYACASGQRLKAVLLLAAGAATLAGIGALRDAGPGALPASFYADRFQVWLAPGEHPHTGQQVLRAAAAIAQGGLAGADSSFGLRSAGLPVGEASAIPAVQDDFAPAFFLNRHGLLAAMALWLLQAAFLAALLWQAVCAQRQAVAARAYQQAWAARFRCFALCGGAAFVAGHLLLSWSTNLAILPVMGQPMSFLSAGGSHLLFLLLPLLGLSAASNEE